MDINSKMSNTKSDTLIQVPTKYKYKLFINNEFVCNVDAFTDREKEFQYPYTKGGLLYYVTSDTTINTNNINTLFIDTDVVRWFFDEPELIHIDEYKYKIEYKMCIADINKMDSNIISTDIKAYIKRQIPNYE